MIFLPVAFCLPLKGEQDRGNLIPKIVYKGGLHYDFEKEIQYKSGRLFYAHCAPPCFLWSLIVHTLNKEVSNGCCEAGTPQLMDFGQNFPNK